VFSLDMTAHN